MWNSDWRKPSPHLTGFVSVWQSQALRILLSFLIFFLTLLTSSLLSLLDSASPVWSYNCHLPSLGLDSVTCFCSHLSLHDIELLSPNQPCSVFHTWTMQTLNQSWAGCHSHPDPWPQHGRIKHLPHLWFLTRQKKSDMPFYGQPPQCKIPRGLGLDLLVILMPGGGIWVLVKNSWYLLRRAIENWSQHLALWPRLLTPLRQEYFSSSSSLPWLSSHPTI